MANTPDTPSLNNDVRQFQTISNIRTRQQKGVRDDGLLSDHDILSDHHIGTETGAFANSTVLPDKDRSNQAGCWMNYRSPTQTNLLGRNISLTWCSRD
jgi:hypothetical protein